MGKLYHSFQKNNAENPTFQTFCRNTVSFFPSPASFPGFFRRPKEKSAAVSLFTHTAVPSLAEMPLSGTCRIPMGWIGRVSGAFSLKFKLALFAPVSGEKQVVFPATDRGKPDRFLRLAEALRKSRH
jgi:hypothetical protein